MNRLISSRELGDSMMNAMIRQCVCGSTHFVDVKSRSPDGKLPAHGKLACALCGAAKFASQYVPFPGDAKEVEQNE